MKSKMCTKRTGSICYSTHSRSLFCTFCRDKSMTPSGFTLKLRKHIRTRRLEDVRQLGYDRVCLVAVHGFGSVY